MQFKIDIATIVLLITIVQGVYLGGVLIFGRSRKHPSTLLGLGLACFSIGLVYDVLRRTNLLSTYPELCYLPVKLYYLPIPLAFLFARKLTPDLLSSKDYLWLIPAIMEFTILSVLFVLPVEVKSSIEAIGSEYFLSFQLYRHLWIPFSIVLLFKSYQIIDQNRERFMNYFSGSQDQLMAYAMKTSLLVAIFCLCFLTKFIVDAHTYDTYIFPVIAFLIMFLVFSVGTWGIKQSFVDFDYEELIQNEPAAAPIDSETHKNADELEKEEISGKRDLENLRVFIETYKPYMDPEFSLDTLAQASKIPSRRISSSINKFANVNFNTFINQFRIDEAKRMLRDDNYNHLSILGIGFEVGFNSKATFYSVFKKQTGMTPAKWQKQVN